MKYLILTVALGTLVLFQNCGTGAEHKPGGESTDSSQAGVSPDLAWSVRSLPPQLNSGGKVKRWGDATGQSYVLYPQWNSSSQQLDFAASPSQITGSLGHKYLRFGEGVGLSTLTGDTGDLSAAEFSVSVVVDRLQFLANAQGFDALRIFDLSDPSGARGGSAVLDMQKTSAGIVKLVAIVYFDSTSYTIREIEVTEQELAAPLAVAVRFGPDADNLQLALNGRAATTAVVRTGSGTQTYAPTSRNLFLHGFSGWYGANGGYDLGEISYYRQALSDDQLREVTASAARTWGGVAVQVGPVVPSVDSDLPGIAVIQSKCVGCHGSSYSAVYANLRGKTAAQIQSALSTVPQMSAVALTATEIQQVAEALK